MIAGLPPFVLIAGPLLFCAAAAAGLALLRTSDGDKAIKARLASVSAAGGRSVAALPAITRKETVRPGWQSQVTGLLGFSLAKRTQYTMPWPVVLGIGLVAGRVVVLLASGVLGGLAWVLMPVVAVAVSRQMFAGMIRKRVSLLRRQLPDALGLIVRAVRVGVPVSEALRVVGRESPAPTAAEFERLADQIAIGASMDAALREMAARNSLPEYGFFAAALTLQAQTGGALGETLELLADVTRKRVAMQARGHALSAEARTSSMILGGLPAVTMAALYFINPDYIGLLFTEETGRMILGLAVLSLSVGVFVMRTIIRKSLG